MFVSPVFVGSAGEYLWEEGNGGIDDGNAERLRAAAVAVQAARVVLQCARPARTHR